MDGTAVVLTTAHRGVFIGTCKGDPSKEWATLTQARNFIYWSSDTGGIGGLAAEKPGRDSRLGSIMPEIRLYDITGIMVMTPEAHTAAMEWPVWRG